MKEKKEIKMKFGEAVIFAIIIAIVCVAIMIITNKKHANINISKVDDWQFKNSDTYSDGGIGGLFSGMSNKGLSKGMVMNSDAIANNESTIGFSTGGAKDVENFRENIKNGYFPISTDITYNGLFYDYTFDTGKKNESEELFSPSYSTAISKDPISSNNEYYMTVGLNSNIKQSDFSRKKLNLVVVLDISGSMSSSFNSYYYDRPYNDTEENNVERDTRSKMEIANESVNILLDQLNDDDRFGMVLFDDKSYLGKPISLIQETDVNALKNHVLEIEPKGGTNFEAGYIKGTTLFNEYKNINSDEYENRIIVITDAMPNLGNTSDRGLLSYVKKNADNKIYTTFIGVGVDFNTELIEILSDVKGANYYSVHSSKEFEERMGEQFEYMVTPLVFDLKLDLISEDYEIESVYGSDTVNKENGNIMNVNTLFPSKTSSNGEVKGGIILLKLKKKSQKKEGKAELKVSYKDRNGTSYDNSQIVQFNKTEEYYENTGIRKGIVLTRYANVIKNWILYERTQNPRFIIMPNRGIIDCNLKEQEIYALLGEHERTSVKLSVSETYKELFEKIKNYVIEENKNINDSTLQKEIDTLEILVK